MSLDEWAERWGIPDEAIRELASVGVADEEDPDLTASSERGVQDRERYAAALGGAYMWRNNRGAFKDVTGRWIRFGLANDSKPLGDKLKSGDLIGITPRLIKVDDVGKILAQFRSRECKKPGWRYTGTPEEQAQLRWHSLILANGGDSAIINETGKINA